MSQCLIGWLVELGLGLNGEIIGWIASLVNESLMNGSFKNGVLVNEGHWLNGVTVNESLLNGVHWLNWDIGWIGSLVNKSLAEWVIDQMRPSVDGVLCFQMSACKDIYYCSRKLPSFKVSRSLTSWISCVLLWCQGRRNVVIVKETRRRVQA